jgi:hypothetical protein
MGDTPTLRDLMVCLQQCESNTGGTSVRRTASPRIALALDTAFGSNDEKNRPQQHDGAQDP